MAFLLDTVPGTMVCHVNGHKIIKDLSLSERFEVLSAIALRARLTVGKNAGFDIYDSALYPGLTFQVKASNAWQDISTRAKIENHGEVYTFNGADNYEADFYILFGLKDDMVYPFLFSKNAWKKAGSKTGKRRIVVLKTARYSRRTKALKENRGWNCYIDDWPNGLHRKLHEHQLRLF